MDSVRTNFTKINSDNFTLEVDKSNDCAYVYFFDKETAHTVAVEDNLYLDLAVDNSIVGAEIMSMSLISDISALASYGITEHDINAIAFMLKLFGGANL